MYEVIQPIGSSRELCGVGPVVSRHRTLRAAVFATRDEMRRLRRQPGVQNSYLDRRILHDGELLDSNEREEAADLAVEYDYAHNRNL